MDPADIHPAIAELVDQLGRLGAKRVVLYGSRARGDNMPRADVDLAVEGVDQMSPTWRAMRAVAEAAGTLLRIDLAALDNATGLFRDNILKDGKILYEQ